MHDFIRELNPFTWPVIEQVDFLETFYFVRFFITKCGFKKKNRWSYAASALAVILGAYVIYFSNTRLFETIPMAMVTLSVFLFLYMQIFLRSSPGHHALLLFVAWTFIFFFDTLGSIFYQVYSKNNIIMAGEEIGRWVIGMKLAEMLIYEVYDRYSCDRKYGNIGIWTIPIFVPEIISSMMVVHLMMINHDKIIIVIQLIFALLYGCCYLLVFRWMNKIYIETGENERLHREKEEIEKRNGYCQYMKKEYEHLKEERHDVKHHVRIMNELIEQGEYDRLGEYLNGLR